MHFKHCGVHQGEFAELIEGRATEAIPFPVIVVGCGTCHQWYFSDLAPAERFSREVELSQAEERLVQECPDHGHKFTIDSGVAP
jgi:hypothetical protein